MSSSDLAAIAQQMVAPGRGVLAADESNATITKRFAALDIESTAENRRSYRNTLLTSPGVEEYIAGVILYEEAIRRKNDACCAALAGSLAEGDRAGDGGRKGLSVPDPVTAGNRREVSPGRCGSAARASRAAPSASTSRALKSGCSGRPNEPTRGG
jgi:hypothetical protein